MMGNTALLLCGRTISMAGKNHKIQQLRNQLTPIAKRLSTERSQSTDIFTLIRFLPQSKM